MSSLYRFAYIDLSLFEFWLFCAISLVIRNELKWLSRHIKSILQVNLSAILCRPHC